MSYLSDPVLTVLLCALAYLAGSMLFALPVCRAWHLPDPRAQGSGNPGATNVYRGSQQHVHCLARKQWHPVTQRETSVSEHIGGAAGDLTCWKRYSR